MIRFRAKKTTSPRGAMFVFLDPNEVSHKLKSMKDGTLLDVEVRRQQKTRSSEENRYYWGVVLKMLSENIGEYTKDEWHGFMNSRFLKQVVNVGGKVNLDYVTSSAIISTKEFEEYLEEIRRWAATTFGLDIPEPNEVEL